jgi:hypothetical protein
LSWFDGRFALPLPPEGEAAVYLFGASAVPPPHAVAGLGAGHEPVAVPAPDGSTALSILDVPAGANTSKELAAGTSNAGGGIAFSPLLTLQDATLAKTAEGAPLVRLLWSTGGRDVANSSGYRLQLATTDGAWQMEAPFDAFRPPEWVTGGRFVAWQRVDGMPGAPNRLELRLVNQAGGAPLVSPGAPDGWHTVDLSPS